jgi:hypothetical protein
MQHHKGSDSECASGFVQISEKNVIQTQAMIMQAFGGGSMCHTWVSEWKSSNLQRPKKVRQAKSKVKSKPLTFFDVKGIVTNK